MYKVKKEGRVLTVNETEKIHYLAEGYDVVEVVDGKYEVVEKATGGRTYTVAEYNAVVKELEAVKAELAEHQLNSIDLQEVLTYAEVKETLTTKGIEFKGNDSHENLLKLLEESA